MRRIGIYHCGGRGSAQRSLIYRRRDTPLPRRGDEPLRTRVYAIENGISIINTKPLAIRMRAPRPKSLANVKRPTPVPPYGLGPDFPHCSRLPWLPRAPPRAAGLPPGPRSGSPVLSRPACSPVAPVPAPPVLPASPAPPWPRQTPLPIVPSCRVTPVYRSSLWLPRPVSPGPPSRALPCSPQWLPP